MKNYQCKNCATLLQSNSLPSASNCPSATFHKWQNLGEIGNTNYQCKNCSTVVKSKNLPSSSGCPKATFHKWSKL